MAPTPLAPLLRAKVPTYTQLEISPPVAEALLLLHKKDENGNVKNRNARPLIIAKYARLMEQGAWLANGESIKIDTDQALFDGQHRLRAIILSGTTQSMLLATGLVPEAQETVDRQTPRRVGDDLKIRGYLNYDAIAAVARRMINWQLGERLSIKKSKFPVTDHDVISLIEATPQIVECAEMGLALKRSLRVPPGVAGLCYWLFSQIDEAQAKDFFERVINGEQMDKKHPCMVLRKTIMDYHVTRSLLPEQYHLAYMIKAWNAFREGREISLLRLKTKGDHPEAFPEPV